MSIRPSGETADYRRGYEAGYQAREEQMDEAAQLRELAKQASPSFRALTDDLAAAPTAEAPAERGDHADTLSQLLHSLHYVLYSGDWSMPDDTHRQLAVAYEDAKNGIGTGFIAAAPAGEGIMDKLYRDMIDGRAIYRIDPSAMFKDAAPAAPAEGDTPFGTVCIHDGQKYIKWTDGDYHYLEVGTKLYTAPRVTGGREAQDAARYRWLRDRHDRTHQDWHVRDPFNNAPDIGRLDAAIDAAMKDTP